MTTQRVESAQIFYDLFGFSLADSAGLFFSHALDRASPFILGLASRQNPFQIMTAGTIGLYRTNGWQQHRMR